MLLVREQQSPERKIDSDILGVIGSYPYKVWDKTKSQSHEFFLIKIDVKSDRVTQLLSIEEMASINRDIRGLVTSEFGLGK
jgi:hypothetical protein